MAIQAVNGVTTTATAAATTASKTTALDKNAFLNLMISQMKYQDPLDPMKADQFLSQLSQMTQVEQLQNISDSLAAMKKTAETGSVTNWISTIGKKMNVDSNVLSKGDQVYLKPAGDYDEVVLTLKNTSGSTNEVRIKKGEPLVYTYDGDDAVTMAAIGLKNKQQVGCTTSAFRIVKGLDMTTSGTPLLIAGTGESFNVNVVKQIKE
jgi:flagellar basal-body rod modification protein FlgD